MLYQIPVYIQFRQPINLLIQGVRETVYQAEKGLIYTHQRHIRHGNNEQSSQPSHNRGQTPSRCFATSENTKKLSSNIIPWNAISASVIWHVYYFGVCFYKRKVRARLCCTC